MVRFFLPNGNESKTSNKRTLITPRNCRSYKYIIIHSTYFRTWTVFLFTVRVWLRCLFWTYVNSYSSTFQRLYATPFSSAPVYNNNNNI